MVAGGAEGGPALTTQPAGYQRLPSVNGLNGPLSPVRRSGQNGVNAASPRLRPVAAVSRLEGSAT